MIVLLTFFICCQASFKSLNEEKANTASGYLEFIKDENLGIEATENVWSAIGYFSKNFDDDLDDNTDHDEEFDSDEEIEMKSDEVYTFEEEEKEDLDVFIDWNYYAQYVYPMHQFNKKRLEIFKRTVEENIKQSMQIFLKSENCEGKEDTEIKEAKYNEGLFAKKEFHEGDIIGLFNGKMYSEKDIDFIDKARYPYLMSFHVTHPETGKETKIYIDPFEKSAKINDCRSNICKPITIKDQKKQNLVWLEFEYLGFPYIAEVIIAKVNINDELLTYYGEEYQCEKPDITASATKLYPATTKLSLPGFIDTEKIKISFEKEEDDDTSNRNLKRKNKLGWSIAHSSEIKRKRLKPTEELYLEAEKLNNKYKRYKPDQKCRFFNNIMFSKTINTYKCSFSVPQSEIYQRQMVIVARNIHFGRCVVWCRTIYELNKEYYESLNAPDNIAKLKEKSDMDKKVEEFNKEYNYDNEIWQNMDVKFKTAEAHKFNNISYTLHNNNFRCTYQHKPFGKNRIHTCVASNKNLARCIIQARELVKQDVDQKIYPMVPQNLGQRKKNLDEAAEFQKKYEKISPFDQAKLYHNIFCNDRKKGGVAFICKHSDTTVVSKNNLFHCVSDCQNRLKENPEKYPRIPDNIKSIMGQLKKKSEVDPIQYKGLMEFLEDD